MSHESRQAIIRAEEQLKQLGKELELDRYLRVDDDPYPSKRVFKLLKNLDLENVSFSNVQSAGNPMYLEKLNRQELFDLVLVNFARLCVNAEWEGLLSSGGGGGGVAPWPMSNPTKMEADVLQDTSSSPPYNPYISSTEPIYTTAPRIFPFIAMADGTLNLVKVNITVAGEAGDTMDIGFYTDDEGVPDELIGKATIATDATGKISTDTFTEDVVTVRNTVYWVAYVPTTLDGPLYPKFSAWTKAQSLGIYPTSQIDSGGFYSQLDLQSSAFTLPANITATDLGPLSAERVRINVGWA